MVKSVEENGQILRKPIVFLNFRDSHRVGGNRKRQYILMNVDQTSLETDFWIAICRPTGDKWQSKTLFLANFDPHSSIVKSVFDCRLPDVRLQKCSKDS